MKIATWNVERLKHLHALDEILLACERTQADILVLTETDDRVHPNYPFCFHTQPPAELYPEWYKSTERRVSLFTKYPCVRHHTTYDPYTAVCVELETERGSLLVYGTIIGIYGNRNPSFQEDLVEQCGDFVRLSAGQNSLCICGDWNCSFGDNYYFTRFGRDNLLQTLSENKIRLLTAQQAQCIDHIAISLRFFAGTEMQIEEWNHEKRLSDHKGISVSFGVDGLSALYREEKHLNSTMPLRSKSLGRK